MTIATLGTFINTLVEEKADIDIPDDVRRILSQITFSERRRNDMKVPQNNLMKMFKRADETIDKPNFRSLSTGKLNVSNLNAVNLTEPQQNSMLRSISLSSSAMKVSGKKCEW